MGNISKLKLVFLFSTLFAFLSNTWALPSYAAELILPVPGTRVSLSPAFNPTILKGIKVHPENPLRFDFILDRGDKVPDTPTGGRDANRSLKKTQLLAESTKLIKYFLASLTVPEKDLWVNLSPYEKDRQVPERFGQTEMGRDLLAQDYMLKQITASLIYPEDDVGKKFWKRVYEETARKFGATDIPVNTFNKVWIVPEKAVVYENAQAGTAYVVESRLKVMIEEDYLALQKNELSPTLSLTKRGGQSDSPSLFSKRGLGGVADDIVREVVIPELTKEINQGRNFVQLRQVYNSLILATWYKKKIKDGILSQVYTDKNKINGLKHPPKSSATAEKIYERYLYAFKKGVYNYIKEDQDPITARVIPRKYFSGGMLMSPNSAMRITNIPPPEINVTSDSAMIVKSVMNPVTYNKKDTGVDQLEVSFHSENEMIKHLQGLALKGESEFYGSIDVNAGVYNVQIFKGYSNSAVHLRVESYFHTHPGYKASSKPSLPDIFAFIIDDSQKVSYIFSGNSTTILYKGNNDILDVIKRWVKEGFSAYLQTTPNISINHNERAVPLRFRDDPAFDNPYMSLWFDFLDRFSQWVMAEAHPEISAESLYENIDLLLTALGIRVRHINNDFRENIFPAGTRILRLIKRKHNQELGALMQEVRDVTPAHAIIVEDAPGLWIQELLFEGDPAQLPVVSLVKIRRRTFLNNMVIGGAVATIVNPMNALARVILGDQVTDQTLRLALNQALTSASMVLTWPMDSQDDPELESLAETARNLFTQDNVRFTFDVTDLSALLRRQMEQAGRTSSYMNEMLSQGTARAMVEKVDDHNYRILLDARMLDKGVAGIVVGLAHEVIAHMSVKEQGLGNLELEREAFRLEIKYLEALLRQASLRQQFFGQAENILREIGQMVDEEKLVLAWLDDQIQSKDPSSNLSAILTGIGTVTVLSLLAGAGVFQAKARREKRLQPVREAFRAMGRLETFNALPTQAISSLIDAAQEYLRERKPIPRSILVTVGLSTGSDQREFLGYLTSKADQAHISEDVVSAGATSGGIDFNSDKVVRALEVRNDPLAMGRHNKQALPFVDPAMIQRGQDAMGFTPVIIDIQSINNIREFLGLQKDTGPAVSQIFQ